VRGQIPLDLGHRAATGREDFLVGESNREAVAWVDDWPNWRANAREVSAALLRVAAVPEVLASATAIVVEGADVMQDERALLHLYNLVVERRGHLLLTAATPPSRWGIALPDLRSRMTALPAIALGPPDDALFAALLVKLFADRQVIVPPEVIGYLAVRLERSMAAAAAAVAVIDRGALALRRPITVPVVREILDPGTMP
jgi:chromosomal replication initiation ATPase DnaA